jgi:energy-coupling factor transporter transmembrane protein EcfT
VTPLWVIVLFWVGCALSLGGAAVYGLAILVPGIASGSGLDPGQVRAAASLLAVYFAGIFVIQLIASVGLTIGTGWAKAVATIVSIAWCLTCVGILVAVAVLNAIWRRSPSPPEPARTDRL